jgi:hypothetical protein
LKSAVNDRRKVKVSIFVGFDFKRRMRQMSRGPIAPPHLPGFAPLLGAPRKLDNVFQIA